MKKVLIIIFIISLGGGLVNAKEKKSKEPLARVEKTKGVEQLILSDKVKNYISKQFPAYHVPTIEDKKLVDDWVNFIDKEKLPPVYAMGDFDGNGEEDISLFLIKGSVGFMVAMNQIKGELKHFILDDRLDELINCRYLSKQESKDILTVYGKGYDEEPGEKNPSKIILKNPALDIGCYEASSSLVYWDNGKYVQIYTSD